MLVVVAVSIIASMCVCVRFVAGNVVSIVLCTVWLRCCTSARGRAPPAHACVLSYYLLPIAYDLVPVDQGEFIWACVQGVIDALKSPQSKRRWPERFSGR